jgi:beta-1,4-glucosyltransferase
MEDLLLDQECNHQNIDIAGVKVADLGSRELIGIMHARLANDQKTALLFANANLIVQCWDMLDWFHREEVLIVSDGVAMDIAALLIHGYSFSENLNGTDFCPALFASMLPPRKIFLIGGRPGVAEKAGEVIRQRFGQVIVGCVDGFDQLRAKDICSQINASGAEIVLVALGNPRQEAWIRKHFESIDSRLIIGVGALLDFLTGTVPRAPIWVRRMRGEWLFRLCLEPKRLLKRYSLDMFRFLYLALRYR